MTEPQAEAVVDLDAFRANIAALKACAPQSAFMAVVKADGYGHGGAQMARAARQAGSDWLGVATLDEALALRQAGDRGDLLCWLAAPGADFAAPIDAGIEVTASSAEQLAEILAAPASVRPKVQLKVDTGLSRNGAFGEQWTELVAAAAAAQSAGSVEITGVWSHFACADQPDHPANDAQEAVVRRGGRRAEGGRARAAAAPPQQLRGDPDQAVGALRPRAGRHRGVRDPARSPTDVRDRADPRHDAAGPPRRRQAGAGREPACRTATPGPPSATRRSGWCRSATARASCGPRPTARRSASPAAARARSAWCAWTSSSSISATPRRSR